MNRKKIIIIIGVIVIYVCISGILSFGTKFRGLDGNDFVGPIQIKPSGISDIHLRQRLRHHRKITAISITLRGYDNVTWVYPPKEHYRPIFFRDNIFFIDLFIEPTSSYIRGFYLITKTYDDGYTDVSTITP